MASAVILPLPPTWDTTLRLTAIATALWCTLSSLEMVAVLPAFGPARALGGDIAALRRGWMSRRPWSRLRSPPALAVLAGLRFAAGIGLVLASGPLGFVMLFATIAGCTGVLGLATGGSDGADKIAIVACVAAVLIGLGRLLDDDLLGLAGVAWGAGQLTIAYVTSGAAKIARRYWRDGTAVAAAMTSYRSGHVIAAAVVRHRTAARVLAWCIMVPEILFPFALFAPPPVCLTVLLGFWAFHAATAIIMGLNTYPWGFATVYPCMLMANALIRHASGLS